MSSVYYPRIADTLLQKKLACLGAVLIEGPKWCGKTTTAEQAARSVVYVSDPKNIQRYITLVDMDPEMLLDGDVPHLIDEWQLIPNIWDTIRFTVDHRQKQGQFILTGSSVPADLEKIHHSGAGRFARMTMRPMTLFESKDSTGEVSLEQLFAGEGKVRGKSGLNLGDIAFLICRGGWPQTVGMDKELALELPYAYLDAVVSSDITRAGSLVRSPDRIRQILRSLSRFQGSAARSSKILSDMTAKEENALSLTSLYSCLDALKRIFVTEDMPAWNPNLRSKTAIQSTDTRYFIDPSIAVAALQIGPEDLLQDLETFGLLFETMAVRDLRVYAESLSGNVYHYRDRNGLECDAVVHLRHGMYGLIEIKLGGDRLIEEGAAVLKKLRDKIDTDKMREPAFLMVLTAVGSFAYRRTDGVLVVPIGCLRN